MAPRAAIGLAVACAIGLAAVVIALASGGSDGEGGAAVVEGPKSPFNGSLMPKNLRAPEFALKDENGRTVDMGSLRGKPVIVTFLYSTCVDTCPIMAQLIRGAMDDLGHDVPALAVSVDPFRDTPASARAFNRRQHVDGRIRWVLGKRRELLPVWKGFAIQPQLPESEHQARITVVDRKGFQRVGYSGAQATPELIAEDVRLLERD